MISRAVIARFVLRPLAIALVSTLLAWAAHGSLWPLDARLFDFGAMSGRSRPHEDIVVLGIDEDFMAGRHPYITPRDRLAKLLDAVSAAQPRAVVLDVWLDSRVDARADAALQSALQRAKKRGVPVFLADVPLEARTQQSARDQSGVTAHGSTLPYFRDAASGAGDSTVVLDRDRRARAIPMFDGLPALPLLAAFPPQNIRPRSGHPDFDRTLRARLEREPVPISWRHEITTTPAMAYVQQPLLAALLEAKTVFIGATYPRSQDFFQTPHDVLHPQKLYGVQVLAQAAATLRDGAPRRTHTSRAAQSATLVLGFTLAALLAFVSWRSAGLGLGVAAVSIAGLFALGLFSARDVVPLLQNRYWPPSLPLLCVLLACGLAVALRSREQARELKLVSDAFGAYVGEEVLAALGGKLPELGGETRRIAVLFCDIRGYSALAESLQNDPARLMSELNAHFEPLVQALKAHGAYADNYVGDLVLALFGAPVSRGFETDVQSAVAAADDFVRLVNARNDARRAAGEQPIEVGIGLHCGEAVVGNLGTKRKIHYTAIGDAVNIASRVESLTRTYAVPLLVTEEIVKCAGGEWRFIDETVVKGRAAPVKVYAR